MDNLKEQRKNNNYASSIRDLNINEKISYIKNSIKDLQNIFYTLYKNDQETNNNKLIFIKRSS